MKIKQFLNLPFQFFNTAKEKWGYIISCTLFFLLFLLVYQPFGITVDLIEDGEYAIMDFIFISLSMASIIFIVLSTSQFILRKQSSTKEITLKHFLKWFFIDVFLITVLTVLILISDDIITFDNFVEEVILEAITSFLAFSFVLLYPVMGNLVYLYLKQLHHHKKELEKDLDTIQNHYKITSGNDDLVKILDEKNTCKLTLPINYIYVLESRNQYVSIKYIKNDRIVEQIIRTRLSKILHELNHFPAIIKCHRSYAVNLVNIERLEFINQKPNIILGTTNLLKVPVSKTYLKEVKSKLSHY